MIEHRKTKTQVMIVPNPDFHPGLPENASNQRLANAVVNLRESSVVTMAARGVLNASQVGAAFKFRNAWEVVEGAQRQSVGFAEWGDHSGGAPALSERYMTASDNLRQCRNVLGLHGFTLVTRVCGEGYSINDFCPSRRAKDTATDMLRVYLDQLARMWGV